MNQEASQPGDTARKTIGHKFQLETDAGATLVWYELGAGPPIIMFASAGREASDFNELAADLARKGYTAILVQPPGIGGAGASVAEPNLFDLAQDVAPILARQDEPVLVLGHAFGNRVARVVATAHPDQVRGVILIGAGGKRPIEPRALEALRASFNPDLTYEERRVAVRYGFFADDSEIPDYWMRGWHGLTAILQGEATARTESALWWAGGTVPMLVIAGMEDKIAPPEDTIDILETEFPTRVTAVRIEGAGHALLPEKPDEISAAVTAWLDGLD
jgi:pimeloyl-ACP methyl ester carboxylesterase